MSEIEKMMQNTGCKLDCCKYAEYGYEGEEGTWYYCKKEGRECWTYPKGDADCVENKYPPFTSEKQIELIKWLARLEPVEIGYSSVYGYWVENQTDIRFYFGDQFDNALASFINILWQDLTEEEKQQVKGILE